MTRRSASMMRICQAAAIHFAKDGYHGTSLNDIATTVGIRKPSLYAHFKSKDELFILVLNDALAEETEFVRQCFSEPLLDEQVGFRYFLYMKQHYAKSVALQFLLQTAYLPPSHLRHRVNRGYRDYLQHLQQQFTHQLSQQTAYAHLLETDKEYFSQAYLGIIDSLHVELIYTDDVMDLEGVFEKRQQAMWRLLQESLRLCISS